MTKGMRRFFNRSLPKHRREIQDIKRRVEEDEIPLDPPTKGDEKDE